MRWYDDVMDMRKGFTLIELIVVVTVIGVLATITIVAYSFMRQDAADTKIRSVVKLAGDALQLYETNNHTLPSGTGRFNAVHSVDSLVPAYLQQDYRANLKSKNTNATDEIFLWYPCKDASGQVTGVAVFAALNAAKAEEAARVAAVATDCHISASIPTSGRPLYNYAQRF